MSETRVINIRSGEPYDVYIGRANWSRRLKHSKWFNGFRIGMHGTRQEVIEKYRQHIMNSPELLAALPELQGKVLACWCVPAACHGHVLVEMADALAAPSAASGEAG